MKQVTFGFIFLFATLVGSSGNVFAENIPANQERSITIQSDDSPGVSYLNSLRGEEGDIDGIVFVPTVGTPVTVHLLDLETVDSKPLKSQSGHDVITISLQKGEKFNPQKGGHIIVHYLYNGATNEYRDFRILIEVEKTVLFRSDPDTSDPKSDKNPYTSVFNNLFMSKHTILGKELGIQKVVPSIK